MRALRSLVVLACAAAATPALQGCGSKDPARLPPPAAPPASPAVTTTPEGRVTPVGAGARSVVVDPPSGLAAVARSGDDGVALVRTATGRVVGTVRTAELGAADGAGRLGLAVGSSPGRPSSPRVLVPAGGALAQVALGGDYDGGRTRRGQVVARAPAGADATDAVELQASGEVAVVSRADAQLRIVRGSRVLRRRTVGAEPTAVSTVDGGDTVVVLAARARTIELYDARTLRRVAREPAGVGPTGVVCRGAGICYVADTTGRSVLIYRWAGRELEALNRQYLDGEPWGLAVDLDRYRVWVTLPGLNRLVELRARTRSRTGRSYPTVRGPLGVAVDQVTGRVLVTGRDGGTLQTVTPRP